LQNHLKQIISLSFMFQRKQVFIISLLTLFLSLSACEKKLRYLGRHDVIAEGDTNYYKIPDFSFLNQDSLVVDQKTLSNYIYVTDFFFTKCPSICPIMAQNLLIVHEALKDEARVKIVSHTLDPAYDTPSVLKKYAFNLGIDTKQWMFLWGSKDSIYDIAERYYIAAVEDDEVPGGINHSGKLVLVDREGHVRGFYEGTKEYGIEELLKDIPVLLKEYEN